MLAKCAKTTFCCPRLVSILNVGAGANGCGSVLGCGTLYSEPCTVLGCGTSFNSANGGRCWSTAGALPVRPVWPIKKKKCSQKKGLKIKCPFVFLPLYEYVDKRKTWHNETESFHSGKMSTSFTSRVHQVRKWAIELSLLNELLSDLVARARVVSKCQRPSVPRALLGHSLPCISPKAKQIPDLDFKSVFYLRRIHLGNLYRRSSSWYFSGVAYNQWIVHWISEYYSKKYHQGFWGGETHIILLWQDHLAPQSFFSFSLRTRSPSR